MVMNLQRIALTYEKAHFLYRSVREVLHLINVLGSFSVILQPWKFFKRKFTYTPSAHKTARKITNIHRIPFLFKKYLLVFNLVRARFSPEFFSESI